MAGALFAAGLALALGSPALAGFWLAIAGVIVWVDD